METLESFKIVGILIAVVFVAIVILAVVVGIVDKFWDAIVGSVLISIGIGIIYGGLYLLFKIGGGPGAFGIILLLPGYGFIRWGMWGFKDSKR
jgi:hypothetical protein